MAFKHDSRGVSAETSGTLLLLPDGWYTLKIMEAEETTSTRGNDMILCKCAPVNEPQYADALIWHYVVFLPKLPDGSAPKGAGISVTFRKAIGVAYGGVDDVDAEEWIGKKFVGYVITDEYTNAETGKTVKRNKILPSVRSIEEHAAETNGLAKPAAPVKKKEALAEVAANDDDVPF